MLGKPLKKVYDKYVGNSSYATIPQAGVPAESYWIPPQQKWSMTASVADVANPTLLPIKEVRVSPKFLAEATDGKFQDEILKFVRAYLKINGLDVDDMDSIFSGYDFKTNKIVFRGY